MKRVGNWIAMPLRALVHQGHRLEPALEDPVPVFRLELAADPHPFDLAVGFRARHAGYILLPGQACGFPAPGPAAMAFPVPVALEPFRDVVAGAESARRRRGRGVGRADSGPADEQERPALRGRRHFLREIQGLSPFPARPARKPATFRARVPPGPASRQTAIPARCGHLRGWRSRPIPASPRPRAARRPPHRSSALLLLPTPRRANRPAEPLGGGRGRSRQPHPYPPRSGRRPTWWDGEKGYPSPPLPQEGQAANPAAGFPKALAGRNKFVTKKKPPLGSGGVRSLRRSHSRHASL